MSNFRAVSDATPQPPLRPRVVAVSSNKGGVGKTTVTANLAIYLRALREDLPVLVMGLDDQTGLDRMFRIGEARPGERNLKHAVAERSLEHALQLGEYGIHFVPSPPDLVALKARAEDPATLSGMLERFSWPGVVVLDTKSDLEALTRNALAAADLVLVPVADRASLLEAAKVFAWLERTRPSAKPARVLLTLGDRRTRLDAEGHDLGTFLAAEVRHRGWPLLDTALTRSPRVEALNSLDGRPRSILHHAGGTLVHRQFRALAEEVLEALALVPGRAVADPPRRRRAPPAPASEGGQDWRSLFLRSLRLIQRHGA